MSNLVYNASLRAGDEQTFAAGNDPTQDNTEEESQEVYTPRYKTQVKLDPLQICLFPTYLSLPEEVLQEDLRTNLKELVTTKFAEDYGDEFSYFELTDAQIDWHSGEDAVCANAMASSAPSQGVPSSREAQPCTCALYTGATALFQHAGERTSDALVTPEQLEPQISSVLQTSLVQALRNDDSTNEERPFYTELKGSFVSWTAAERQSGGKLVYFDPPEFEQQISEPPLAEEPSTTVLDESFGDSTTIDAVAVSAIDGSDIQENAPSGANAFSTKKGKILASVLGAVLFVALVVLGFVLLRNKKRRNSQSKDNSTVVSQDELPRDEVDEEIARGGQGLSKQMDAEEDDQSEAAQYKVPKNNLLDCISVGSEWTLTTGSMLGYCSNKSMAEMMAAKETFDRDRQITLQKDMLQSEWSSPVSPSALALSRKGSKSTVKKSEKTTTIASGDAASGGLKFAEAEGEEIYLMPSPTR